MHVRVCVYLSFYILFIYLFTKLLSHMSSGLGSVMWLTLCCWFDFHILGLTSLIFKYSHWDPGSGPFIKPELGVSPTVSNTGRRNVLMPLPCFTHRHLSVFTLLPSCLSTYVHSHRGTHIQTPIFFTNPYVPIPHAKWEHQVSQSRRYLVPHFDFYQPGCESSSFRWR